MTAAYCGFTFYEVTHWFTSVCDRVPAAAGGAFLHRCDFKPQRFLVLNYRSTLFLYVQHGSSPEGPAWARHVIIDRESHRPTLSSSLFFLFVLHEKRANGKKNNARCRSYCGTERTAIIIYRFQIISLPKQTFSVCKKLTVDSTNDF